MSEPEHSPSSEDIVEAQLAEDLDGDAWIDMPRRPSLVARMFAEAGGTFILVFVGLGTMAFAAAGNNGTLTTALGFAVGLTITIVIFGGISGAHVNPAVTVGLWLSGRFPGMDVVPYVISQVIGGLAAGGALFALVSTHPEITEVKAIMSSTATGYGEHSPFNFGLAAAIGIETILVAILVAVVLAVTSVRAAMNAPSAPLVIGLAFGFLMLVAIPITGGALNPARATGPALFADIWALQQLWVFWVAPIVGAAIAGLLFRAFGPEEDLIIIEQVD